MDPQSDTPVLFGRLLKAKELPITSDLEALGALYQQTKGFYRLFIKNIGDTQTVVSWEPIWEPNITSSAWQEPTFGQWLVMRKQILTKLNSYCTLEE